MAPLFLTEMSTFLQYGVGCPQNRETYFYLFLANTNLLVYRQITENIVEIHSQLSEISAILECGVELPQKWITHFNIFNLNFWTDNSKFRLNLYIIAKDGLSPIL